MWAALLVPAMMLGGCNAYDPIADSGGLNVFNKVRALDLLPRNPQPEKISDISGGPRPQAQIYPGSGSASAVFEPSPPGVTEEGGGQGYDLNFENAPIATVAKAILGDILHVGYVIDPRIQGTVTLSSGRPVPKSKIVFVLEAALRMSNVALVRNPGGYRLVSLGDAQGSGSVDRSGSVVPGYGVSIVPLKYISARSLAKLIDSFATRPGAIRVDEQRNIVLIQGTGAERQSAIQTVLSFDTDWMRGQSVGIFPLRNSSPEQVIADLKKIIDSGDGGLSQDLIKLQPIDRMSAVLAVAKRQSLLSAVSKWVQRLDGGDMANTNVHVYHVRYGDARQIARVLNNLFVGNSGASLDAGSDRFGSSPAGNALARLGVSSQPGSASSSSGSPFGGIQNSFNSGSSHTSPGENQPSLVQRASSVSEAANKREQGEEGGEAGQAGQGQGGGGAILRNIRITADPITNTLLIYATQQNYSTIEATLRQIDRPQLQVAINATIAEVTLNKTLNYGVQFYLSTHGLGFNGSMANSYNSSSALNVANTIGPVLPSAFPGFNFLLGSQVQPQVILDALHEVTGVKVLSNPSLVVMDNSPAVLQVGDEIPVSTGSATVLTTNNTIVNTIDYKNTGVILNVVPRVNVNGNVVLTIQQEISDVADTSTANTLTPTVSQRKVMSTISVANGQTVLLAGLIGEQQSSDHPGIPGVDQIPLIGNAFSHTFRQDKRTELIIFIRPQIIRDNADAAFVAEELRSKLESDAPRTPRPIHF